VEIDEVPDGIIYKALRSHHAAQPSSAPLTTLKLAVKIPKDHLAKPMNTLLEWTN